MRCQVTDGWCFGRIWVREIPNPTFLIAQFLGFAISPAVDRFRVTWSEAAVRFGHLSDTSMKSIDREGLGERRTETR